MALRFFYRNRVQHIEAESAFGAAIEKLGEQESVVLGKLLAIQADILHTRFRFDQARVYAEKSIDMLRRLGAVRDTVEPLVTLGNVIGYAFNDDADLEAQSAAFHEALEIARQNDDLLSVMAVTYWLGWSAFNQGHVKEAKDVVSQAHVQALRFGNVAALSYTFQCLGFIAIRVEDYNEARQLLQNGLANARKAQDISTHMDALDGLRRVELEQGNLSEARRFAEEAVKIERDLGRENDLFFCLVGQAEVALASSSLEEFGGLLRETIEIYEHFDDRFFIHFLSDIVALSGKDGCHSGRAAANQFYHPSSRV